VPVLIFLYILGGYQTMEEMTRCMEHAQGHEITQCVQSKIEKAEAQFGMANTIAQEVVFPYYGIK